MKIKLISLKLTNFKKIRNLKIDFENTTNIFGNNGTGKTSLFDAFLWLLFGKNSTDTATFEIKTLDENNQAYHNLEHEVEGVLLVDGIEHNLRRSLREKWVKKRGLTEEEFTGHETKYFWNEVPMKQEEFNSKIAGIINESLFKLLTSTTYFNNLKWQDRRMILEKIAGVIDDVAIIKALNLDAVQEKLMLDAYGQGKGKDNFKEFKAEINGKSKKIKQELETLPDRIKEAERAVPNEEDFTAVEANIATIKTDIAGIDDMLQSKSAAYQEYEAGKNKLISQRQAKHMEAQQIAFNIQNDVKAAGSTRKAAITEKKGELQQLNSKRQGLLNDYNTKASRKTAIETEQQNLRTKWAEENARMLVFDDKDFCCPTCKRAYEAGDVDAKKEEMERNFNQDKASKLEKINQQGASYKPELEQINTALGNIQSEGEKVKAEIETLQSHISELETEYTRLSADEAGQYGAKLAAHAGYQTLQTEIASLTTQIDEPYTAEDNSAMKFRKNDLQRQLEELQRKLATKGMREKQQARVTELSDQEQKLNEELAAFEGIEFSIKAFEKAKMNELESRINNRFAIAKFKLFQTNINGGEEPCCITLFNGVPYPDANTAGKIQVGLDIINTLSGHYGVQAPVWVDNRESVVSLPETECQLINLIVSEADNKLRIEKRIEKSVA